MGRDALIKALRSSAATLAAAVTSPTIKGVLRVKRRVVSISSYVAALCPSALKERQEVHADDIDEADWLY